MNGSVPPLLEKDKHEEISNKCRDLVQIFYKGDPLTALELDIEKMYIQ
jgi:hypothetical protein